MTATHDPFGPLGAPGGRRPDDMRPAPDPWETGERIFGIQWNTGEQRLLEAEWKAGQQAFGQPAFDQPAFGQPAFDQPAFDQPAFDQPAFDQPAFDRQQRPPRRHVGHPRPARAAAPPVYAPPPEPPRERRGRGRLAAVLIVVALLAVSGLQTWRLDRNNDRLAAVLATERDRTDRLAKQLAGVFDPEAISTTVLPSVFRVRAGEFTGTAFAVGDESSIHLLTNYHVVESVWSAGDREVTLERGGTKMTARIVKVSRGKDLALLRGSRPVRGLTPAAGSVKPGQPILVVGAPLGLEDSVTTGVVSAYRPDDADGQSIQFDAPINPGNSGGPVVNAAEEVVGLATAKARDAEGIGLAVSIDTACELFKVC